MNMDMANKIWTISPANTIEGEAIRQLERAGSLPGMLRMVDLPIQNPWLRESDLRKMRVWRNDIGM